MEKRDEPNWNCSLSISRIEAGATRWREISCRQATPLSKLGNTMEPYLRQSGIGLIFIITSVTTPSVPANRQYTTHLHDHLRHHTQCAYQQTVHNTPSWSPPSPHPVCLPTNSTQHTFIITSVTTPSVPTNSQYTTQLDTMFQAAGRCSVQKGKVNVDLYSALSWSHL